MPCHYRWTTDKNLGVDIELAASTDKDGIRRMRTRLTRLTDLDMSVVDWVTPVALLNLARPNHQRLLQYGVHRFSESAFSDSKHVQSAGCHGSECFDWV